MARPYLSPLDPRMTIVPQRTPPVQVSAPLVQPGYSSVGRRSDILGNQVANITGGPLTRVAPTVDPYAGQRQTRVAPPSTSQLPFLRGPSSGAVVQRKTTGMPIETAGRPVTQADLDRSRAAMRAAASYMKGYGLTGEQERAVRRVPMRYMEGGNPILMGGTTAVPYGERTARIPTGLLQYLKFTDAYNQGRSNAVQKFLTGGPKPTKEMPYSSYGASVGLAERALRRNPDVMVSGELDPYQRSKSKYNRLRGAYKRAQKAMMGTEDQPLKERRATSGAIMGADVVGQRQKELAQAKSAMEDFRKRDKWLNKYRGRYHGAFKPQQILGRYKKDMPRMTRTISSKPIKETLVA